MTPGELARDGFSEEKAGNGQSEPGQRAGHATKPLAFAWPDIAVTPDRHCSEEQRRPGCLRQGDRYRGQAIVLRKGERPDLEGCPGLRPGDALALSEERENNDRAVVHPAKPRPQALPKQVPRRGSVGGQGAKAWRQSRYCRTLRHAHLHRPWFPKKPKLAWVERLPGPPPGPARLPRKDCRNRQQHLGRGRCRLPFGLLPKKQPAEMW
jgi:hypothetical protein